MSNVLKWIKGARWRMSLSHCFEGLLIQAPVTLLTGNEWFGAFGVVIWYWSRKKLEAETSIETAGQTHVDTWAAGWFPWQWGAYMVLDVVLPALTSFLIAYLIAIWA
ncbi:hypothetical protein WK03_35295 [Burkholderia cepacia]|uniref:hypothetical protein n=1 Tax=Burkholderia cepacia TaxID=292 RepID=UPI000751FA5F|nr:hypothetical protein [Burkholderia cepacia]KVQ35736.1 hypothetical protein WK03_35295 [Burkholderia cepacia]